MISNWNIDRLDAICAAIDVDGEGQQTTGARLIRLDAFRANSRRQLTNE